MLSAVRSKWVTVLASTIAVVVVVSMALGLSSPDGKLGEAPDKTEIPPSPITPVTSAPTTSPSAKHTPASGDIAPATVSGIWPGRPASTMANDSGAVDWCPAVQVSHSGEADQLFGKKSVRRAACAAVTFVFDQRYSRLAVPRKKYKRSDFDDVLDALTGSTATGVYRPRVNAFTASPNDARARESLGLVMFTSPGTAASAAHASAGEGRVFYGKAFSAEGYRERAAWINPEWSTVRIGIDRAKAAPRITASFTASASMPVYNPSHKRDDMVTVPTRAGYTLRAGRGKDPKWSIDSWQVTTETMSYGPLAVND